MMKKITLVAALILAVCCSVLAVIPAIATEPEVKSADELFSEYYNGGAYTRHNQIFVAEQGTDDVFHGPIVLTKYTYFNGRTLWMDTNSGYTSDSVGATEQLNHFTLNEDTKAMENVVSYGNLGDIDSFFVTMKDFDDMDTVVWTEIDGGYSTTDAKALDMVMAFAASCFTNKDNYVTLESAEIKEEGEQLVFYLYVNAASADKVTSGNRLLAKTVVSRGVGDFVIN